MVVICLKNRTFAVSQTTVIQSFRSCRTLWFAWKIVLLQYRKQPLWWWFFKRQVVICLKNRTFAVSQTTPTNVVAVGVLLWFAWKIVLLQYRKQLLRELLTAGLSCDLLEKSYFCSIANNYIAKDVGYTMLWFAWKIVLLQYRKQRMCGCYGAWLVVICLKNRTFAVSQTTAGNP